MSGRRTARAFAAFVVALSGVVVAGGGWAPLSAQTDRPELIQVRFQGNVVFPEDSLRRSIVNRQTVCRLPLLCRLGIDLKDRSYLQPREVTLDALRLEVYYLERGYREAQVDTALTALDGGVALTFSIEEGPPVTVDSVEVFTFDEIPDSALIRDLPLTRGDPLSALLLEATRDTLQARLRNNGFAFADVLVNYDIVPRGSHSAEVMFDVATGPRTRFGPISVLGAQELDTISVRRMLPFRGGQLFRANSVIQGQRNLYALELIQSARVVPILTEGDTIVPVQVNVSEGQVHRVRGGFGWTTAECLTAESSWASRNFMGGARRLTVRARVSNILAESLRATACKAVGDGDFARLNWQVSAELVQPFLFSSRNSLSASTFVERQSLNPIFIRRAVGLDLAFSRDLGNRLTFSAGWRPALTDLDAADLFFCASFAACLPADIEIFEGANWLSPLALGFTQDRRNSLLNPTAGYAWILDFEHARSYTASDFEYNRLLAEASTYVQSGSLVLAGRIGAGIAGRGQFEDVREGRLRVVHPQKRFFSGGANSVRGFAENRLGPRVLTTDVENLLGYPSPGAASPVCVPAEILDATCDPEALADGSFFSQPVGGTVRLEANAEVRFPMLVPALQGVGFVDVGQVWAERSQVTLDALEVTPGVGVRYLSPIGPIRVDVAYRFRGAELLPVATQGLRAFGEGDDPGSRVDVRWADGTVQTLDWVKTNDVTFLSQGTLFGGSSGFWSRLQLHISIGQAF